MVPFDFLDEGRYELLQLLGEGGMAAVYLAWDTRLRRPVAIKIPHANVLYNLKIRSRFRQEIIAMARAEHPRIVRLYDSKVEALENGLEVPYIVMEFVRGSTLDSCLPNVERRPCFGALNSRLACRMMLEVLQGLGCLHAEGIIHRDVKPANIMVGLALDATLMDFGVAFVEPEDQRNTRTTATMGTAAYMAPEQMVRPKDAGPTADIYAVATTLFAAIAAADPTELWLREEADLVDVPEPLRPILIGATRYAVKDRAYATTQEMECALAEAIARLPEEPEREENLRAWISGRWKDSEIEVTIRARQRRGATPPPFDEDGSAPSVLPGWYGSPNGPTRSETIVPETFDGSSAEPPPMLGVVPDPVPSPPPAPRSSPPRWPKMLAIGGAIGFAITAGLAIWLMPASPGERPIVELPVDPSSDLAQHDAVEPPVEHPTVVVETPAPASSPSGDTATPVAKIVRKNRPSPVTEKAAPIPTSTAPPVETDPVPSSDPVSAPPKGTVRFSGGADKITFVDSGGTRYSPGDVPVGAYEIRAVFSGETDASMAGTVRVAANETVTVACQAMFHLCKPQ